MGSITKATDRAGRLQELEGVIERSAQAVWDMAYALSEIKSDGLFRETHNTWGAYCEERWSVTRKWADRMVASIAVVERLSTAPMSGHLPTHVTQALELQGLPEEDQPKAWAAAVERAEGRGKSVPTVKEVRQTVREHTAKKNGRPEPSREELAHDAAKTMRHSAEAFVTSVERLVPHMADLPDDEARSCSYKVAETVHAALAVLRDAGVLDPSVMHGLLNEPVGREILV